VEFQGDPDTKEVEVEGTKTRAERNEKGSPQPQASSDPLLNKEGSAICDWFLKLFSHCQDSTISMLGRCLSLDRILRMVRDNPVVGVNNLKLISRKSIDLLSFTLNDLSDFLILSVRSLG
jgi:hypothetical protein